jgi:DNA-binding response OmpR family regulator
MSDKPLILIVEDEQKIAELVTMYLEKSGYRVLCTPSGQRALELVGRESIALVLLDLMLPDLPGEEVCSRIRQTRETPIIMMTARVDEESIVAGLSGGADDYITKPFSPRQLVARVEAVLRRSQGLPESDGRHSLLHSDDLSVDLTRRLVLKVSQPLELTTSEYRILTLLIGHPLKTFTRTEILERVSGEDSNSFDRVVDSHIKNLRQKLGSPTQGDDYIRTVYGTGYRWGQHVW